MSVSDILLPRAPIRIAHVNSLLNGGGTDDQCVKLAHGLCQLGQRVWLAGPVGRDYSKVSAELAIPSYETPREGPLKARLILSVAKLIRREGIQVVHGHHGRDLWPTILAARLSGVRPKIVLTRHLAKSPASWGSRHFLLSSCDGLIAVSHFVAGVLRRGAFEPGSRDPERRARPPLRGDYTKIHVIHGGVDTGRFKPKEAADVRRLWGLQPEHQAFAVVGGYDAPRGKGQREFLRAAARIRKDLPSARFLIVGRGTLKNTLESDIRDLGLAGKAWLTPYCHEMPMAMNAVDCLVHPQVATEAFPGVILEAFACGKPVIASALDGIPEGFAIGQCGELVPPGNIEALAAALVRQARLPALTWEARQALHQRVARQHSIMAHARRVLGLYTRLLCAEQWTVPVDLRPEFQEILSSPAFADG